MTALETGKINTMEFLSRVSYGGNQLIGETLVLTDDDSEVSDFDDLGSIQGTPGTASISGESSSQKDNTCVVCFIQPRKVLYLPCGHYVTCESCNREILKVFNEKVNSFEMGSIDVEPILRCPACNLTTTSQVVTTIYL